MYFRGKMKSCPHMPWCRMALIWTTRYAASTVSTAQPSQQVGSASSGGVPTSVSLTAPPSAAKGVGGSRSTATSLDGPIEREYRDARSFGQTPGPLGAAVPVLQLERRHLFWYPLGDRWGQPCRFRT